MSDDPEIPDTPPDDRGAETEIDDQPLGTPEDLDPEDAPLPGVPETEPPSAG
jgi:hypothetical protein